MPIRMISQTEFLELPDWKERILEFLDFPARDRKGNLGVEDGEHPFLIDKEYSENPLDDWHDISLSDDEIQNPLEIVESFPPEKLREITIYLLNNMDKKNLVEWHKYLLGWLHRNFGADREILEKWIDLHFRVSSTMLLGERELAKLAIRPWPMAGIHTKLEGGAIKDMIDLFPDEVDWENVLNIALKGAANAFSHKSKEPPFSYILEELVNFVYSRNPSFRPD